MVGVAGKYKGCNSCRLRRVKVSLSSNSTSTTDQTYESAMDYGRFARNVPIPNENVAMRERLHSSLEQ